MTTLTPIRAAAARLRFHTHQNEQHDNLACGDKCPKKEKEAHSEISALHCRALHLLHDLIAAERAKDETDALIQLGVGLAIVSRLDQCMTTEQQRNEYCDQIRNIL